MNLKKCKLKAYYNLKWKHSQNRCVYLLELYESKKSVKNDTLYINNYLNLMIYLMNDELGV